MLFGLAVFVTLVGCAVAIFMRNRVRGRPNPDARWSLLAGAPLAIAAVTITYRYSEEYFGVGLPLIAAAFEVKTGADFVSPLTPLIFAFDFGLILLAPYSVLVLFRAWQRRHSGAEVPPNQQ